MSTEMWLVISYLIVGFIVACILLREASDKSADRKCKKFVCFTAYVICFLWPLVLLCLAVWKLNKDIRF